MKRVMNNTTFSFMFVYFKIKDEAKFLVLCDGKIGI